MSEENSNNENTVDTNTPSFLKVICILTYVGCSILIAIWLIILALGAEYTSTFSAIPGMTGIGGNIIAISALFIIANALGIYSAMQMWKLQKTGFFIYIGHHVFNLIIPVFFGGEMLLTAATLVFPAAFIVLYGLNFKHLK
ncbi:MAG: hypothetical protein CL846_10280 [Crocinitomicaceae bacterium]|nr:hypothetical protein [Crocinitomicaceae bacterium]|tara:strand:- start:2093 stop:2515 length:423 start_codon:yes stop_codon:yes gene_type:complete